MKRKIAVIMIATLALTFTACGSSDDGEAHIYDNATIEDVMNNAPNNEKIGEYSLIEVDSSEVTEDALSDWYFNYIEPNADDYNWFVIHYTDKDDNSGCYCNGSDLIEENIYLSLDESGVYGDGESNIDSTWYLAEDGELVVSATGEELEAEGWFDED